MTAAAFDFRKPPSGEPGRQAAGWLALAARRAAGVWSRALAYKAELRPGPVEAVTAGAALAGLPADAVASLLSPVDADAGAIVLAVRRPVLLALLGGLLGETPADLPADRDPSDLEGSLVPYLLRELFVDPIERGWPGGGDPLGLTAGPLTAPRLAWPRPPADPALLATLTAAGPFGEHPVHLLFSRAGRWESLSRTPAVAADAAGDRGPIEAVVREMKVELDVVLGTAELTMADVGRLRAGDVVLLRQRVTDPLDGLVAGSRKFRVWPGAVGSRAAVQVDAATAD